MRKILVPIDFSSVTARSLQVAQELAKTLFAKIILLAVNDTSLDHDPGERIPATSELDEAREKLEEAGCDVIAIHQVGDVIPDVIFQVAKEFQVAFIVMGSHGHGMVHEVLLGSVSASVLRKAQCPVMVVPTPKPDEDEGSTVLGLENWQEIRQLP
ncbi:universal stress protein [Phycisphaeraceae bacterium D3-23]